MACNAWTDEMTYGQKNILIEKRKKQNMNFEQKSEKKKSLFERIDPLMIDKQALVHPNGAAEEETATHRQFVLKYYNIARYESKYSKQRSL